MSRRRQLREIRRERGELMERDLRLRTELGSKFGHLRLYLQIADQAFSFLGALVGRSRGRRRSRR